MSKMRSMLAMYAMSLAVMNDSMSSKGRTFHESPESEQERRDRVMKERVKINRARGLTEFFYGENSTWALNQKSADKKAKRKGWI